MTLSAYPTELMDISMNQSVTNIALSFSGDQSNHFPDRYLYDFGAYARQPSVSAVPVVRNVEEIFGSHDSGSVSNTDTSPSTGRSYRYKVVYDYLVSDWYVCDCESATFERIGWVDTSEVRLRNAM